MSNTSRLSSNLVYKLKLRNMTSFALLLLLLSMLLSVSSAFTISSTTANRHQHRNCKVKSSLLQLRAKKNEIVARNGLVYEDIEIGTGRNVFAGDTVLCYYSGSYVEGGSNNNNNPFLAAIGGGGGKVITFDETQPGEPAEILVGKGAVIPGWDLGICGDPSCDIPAMKIGGDRKLIIPAALAYGKEGAGNGAIPPNTDLSFQIAILNAEKKGGSGVSKETQVRGFAGLVGFLVFMAGFVFIITQNINKFF